MLFSPPRDILAPGQIIVSATQAEESTPEMRTSCSALVTGTSEGRCNGRSQAYFCKVCCDQELAATPVVDVRSNDSMIFGRWCSMRSRQWC